MTGGWALTRIDSFYFNTNLTNCSNAMKRGWALTRYDSYFITNLEEHLKYRDYYRMIRSNSSEYAQPKLISRPNFLPVACK